jgi:DNA-binding PucR family transcriptional regulator
LRETVLAFLVSGGSPTRVAEELFVHKNTVAERIKRAEGILAARSMRAHSSLKLP